MTKTDHCTGKQAWLLCMLLSLILSLPQTSSAKPGNFKEPDKKELPPVTGRVTSALDNQPLQGVSVAIKGTTTGATTDANGTFSLNNVEANATLVFSYVGYQTQEVAVRGRAFVDVALQIESGTLVETIVTANAIRRDKRSLGYSAPVVRGDELLAGRNTSPLNALQGKIAGVNITSTANAPNSSSRIVLRGGSSIQGNNQALMVIDGIPIDNSGFVGGSDVRNTLITGNVDPRSTVDFGNRGNDINPEDIESITVLKGPTAAALYGSRASNGAVVITTKSGRKGQKNEVTVSSTLTLSNILKLPKYQNGFGQGYYSEDDDPVTGDPIFTLDPIENFSWGPAFTGVEEEWGQAINGVRLRKPYSAEEDNVKDFFELGKLINNTASFAGSGDKTTFYLSLNSLNSDGVFPTNKDNYNRYNVRFNGSAELSNKFTASVGLSYAKITSNLVQGGQGPGSVFDNVLQTPRNIPLQDMDDLNNPYYGYGFLNDRGEPVYGYYGAYTINPWWLIRNYRNENDVDRITGNFTITYKPADWLTVVERLGADVYADRRRFKYPKFSYAPADETSGNYTADDNTQTAVGQYRENNFNVSEIIHDLMVTAKKDFGQDLSASLLLGHNVRIRQQTALDASTNQSTGLVVPGWYNFDNSNGPLYNFNEFSRRRLIGVYAQLSLGWKDLIFLDLTGRNDWSSTLPINNRSFFYPSASASFVFTELTKDAGTFDFLNYGKIRASVAQVGNDANPYLLQNYYARPTINSGGFGTTTFPFNGVPGLTTFGRIGSPDLKPEITTAFEIGTELSFLNNRLYFDFSYYQNKSRDQILTIPIAESTGFTSKVINGGSVENKGIELSARGIPIRSGGFTLEVFGTFTRNRNKVLDLNLGGVTQVSLGGLADMAVVAAQGMPYGTFYGVDLLKDDQGRVVVDSASGLPLTTPNPVYFGSYNPDWLASWGFNANYKGWSLRVLMDTKHGGNFVSRTKDIIDFNGTAWETAEFGRNRYVFPNSVYEVEGQPGKYNPNTTPMLPQDYFTDMPYGQHVLDASYVKLREVSLSYRIPKRALTKTPFGDITVGLFGNNLALWVPSRNKFVDPEINSAGAGNLQGFDFTAQPSQRNFGVNVSASF